MLELLNTYAHGYVLVPLVCQLHACGLFERTDAAAGRTVTEAELAAALGANTGVLRTLLHALESLGWLTVASDGALACSVEARDVAAHIVHSGLLELFSFPWAAYVGGGGGGGGTGGGDDASLATYIAALAEQWRLPLRYRDRWTSFMSGALVVPLFLALRRRAAETAAVGDSDASSAFAAVFNSLSPRVAREVSSLFTLLSFLDGDSALSAVGAFVWRRTYNFGVVGSYHGLLGRLDTLLCGDFASLFTHDADGHEEHVDRTLNVVGSGSQHERFFADMAAVVGAHFDTADVAAQPLAICDMGCGDGTLLRRLYTHIRANTRRGDALVEHPLLLIGADFNSASLTATAATLADIPTTLLVHGDVGDPAGLNDTLRAAGVEPDRVFHVRSFLDHDRPFIPGRDGDALASRVIAMHRVHTGLFVSADGALLSAAEAQQSLVEHLQRWGDAMAQRQVLAVLEVHALAPAVVRRHLLQCENLHFDCVQALSRQYIVEAASFVRAAAEAGLFPHMPSARAYPRSLSFTRITFNVFVKRSYCVRSARPDDIPTLLALEAACWPAALRAREAKLAARIAGNPLGQLVLERDGCVLGALYTQRITDASVVHDYDCEAVETLHAPHGKVLQLLALCVSPAVQAEALGDQLLVFALHCARLTAGIERIVGVTRTRDFARHAATALPAVLGMAEYAAMRTADAHGRPVDATLAFHEAHGAAIGSVVKGFRPLDDPNGGDGVLIEYSAHSAERLVAAPSLSQSPSLPQVYNTAVHSASTTTSGHGGLAGPQQAVPVRTVVLDALERVRGRRDVAVELNRPLMDAGFDSMDMMELRALLGGALGLDLATDFFFEYATPNAVIAGLSTMCGGVDAGTQQAGRDVVLPLGTLPFVAPSGAGGKLAIVGMAVRLPGADDVPSFWSNLRRGTTTFAPVPLGRWGGADAEPLRLDAERQLFGCWLPALDMFDASFFGVNAACADVMDPQHRLCLELAWEALEDASLPPDQLAGGNIGVFVGLFAEDYRVRASKSVTARANPYFGTGVSGAACAGRLSYFLGVHGPAVTVNTACSSSLVALHIASQALRAGDCTRAVVCGVNLLLDKGTLLHFADVGMLSSSGVCAPLDAAADGTVMADAGGAIILEDLAVARQSGSRILGVIESTAVNQDGRSSVLTAPNPRAQRNVMAGAMARANCSPADVDVVEMHGTGTRLGDPMEANSINAVFGDNVADVRAAPLVLGSVKANVGHGESAAGLTSLVKVLLQMRHQLYVAHPSFRSFNEEISRPECVVVNTANAPWTAVPGRARRALINSFGFSGTNASTVVSQHVLPESSGTTAAVRRGHGVLTLSAATEAALRDLANRYLTYVDTHPTVNAIDIGASSNVARTHHAVRLAVTTAHGCDLRARLCGRLEEPITVQPIAPPSIVFHCTGRRTLLSCERLYTDFVEFRAAFGAAVEAVSLATGRHYTNIEVAMRLDIERASQSLADEWSATGAFITEYAMLRLMQSLVHIDHVVCTGVGESVAIVANGGTLANAVQNLLARTSSVHGEVANAADASVIVLTVSLEHVGVEGGAAQLDGDGTSLRVFGVLATLYERGCDIDWQVCTPRTCFEIVPLPTYAFQRKSFWYDTVRTADMPDANNASGIQAYTHRHEILGDPVATSDSVHVFESTLSPQSPTLVADHRIYGHYLLAGASYISALLTYSRDVMRSQVLVVRDIEFLGAFIVSNESPRILRTKVTTNATYRDVTMTSRGYGDDISASVMNMKARVAAFVEWHAIEGTPDVAGLLAEARDTASSDTLSGGDWVQLASTKLKLDLGASFQWIESIYQTGDAIVAILRSANNAAERDASLVMHPGLIDGLITTFVSLLVRENPLLHIPFSIESFEYRTSASLPRFAVVSSIERREAAGVYTADIFMYDSDSECVGVIRGLNLRAVPEQSLQRAIQSSGGAPIDTWTEAWLPMALNVAAVPPIADILYVVVSFAASEGSAVRNICTELERLSANVYHVQLGGPDSWTSLLEGAFAHAIERQLRVAGLVLAQPLTGDFDGSDIDIDAMIEVQRREVESMLAILQWFARLTSDTPTSVCVLTNGTCAVDGGDGVDIIHAPINGMCRTLQVEYDHATVRQIDVAAAAGVAIDPAHVAQEILAFHSRERCVLLRGEERFVARVRAGASIARSRSILPTALHGDSGVFLVTGGLGALGRLFAQRLVDDGARRILLTGRHSLTEKDTVFVAAMNERASVEYVRCDISVDADVQSLIASLQSSGGEIVAVLHAAGVVVDAAFDKLAWDSHFAPVWSAKVLGTMLLHRHISAVSPSARFVLFSSVVSQLGSAGQANYAAANAFMDAFAQSTENCCSVNWGPFGSAGMATAHTSRFVRNGIGLVSTADGVEYLRHAISPGGNSSVFASTIDWQVHCASSGVLVREWASEMTATIVIDAATNMGGDSLDARVLQAPKAVRVALVEGFLVDTLGMLLDGAPVDGEASVFDQGVDSLLAVELRNQLQNALSDGFRLPSTLLFDYPTVDALGSYVLNLICSVEPNQLLEYSDNEAERVVNATIAVVGIGCRFPGGSSSPSLYWQMLRAGTDTMCDVPPSRWTASAFYSPDATAPGKMITTVGGFLDGDIREFDAAFFNIMPREAALIDPQSRVLLEVSNEAFENAAVDIAGFRGGDVGVYVGLSVNDWSGVLTQIQQRPDFDAAYRATGTFYSTSAGRISYTFGFEGPNIALDTACSSSLVAVHLAVNSLRAGETSFALAAGCNIMTSPETSIGFSKAGMLSPSGRCRTFDVAADGYGRGEGCGVVLLERADDARAAGRRVLALVRGGAVNQDGASGGLTVPSGAAQERVLRRALRASGLTGADAGGAVQYIEAHGTGTPLGDPIEVRALASVYGGAAATARRGGAALVLGTVKTNIGHLEAAAGVAGVIKVVLALERAYIPRHLHFTAENPLLELASIPAVVPHGGGVEWRAADGERRRAGVSGFGFSGTNAHVVLEEAPDRESGGGATGERAMAYFASAFGGTLLDDVVFDANAFGGGGSSPVTRPYVFALSAKSEEALAAQVRQHAAYAAELSGGSDGGGGSAASVAYTLATGRTHHRHRVAVVCSTLDELSGALAAREKELGGTPPSQSTSMSRRATVGFLLTGQGSQYAGAGRELYERHPVFRAAMRTCDELVEGELGRSVIALLYEPGSTGGDDVLHETAFTQPVLFCVGYALAAVWQSMGVTASCMLGHSVGELLAATLCGAIGLSDALRLVVARGRWMQESPAGGMVAVRLGAAAVAQHVARVNASFADGRASALVVAGVNSPQQTVVSGGDAELGALVEALGAAGVKCTRLRVRRAFHSAGMLGGAGEARARFVAALERTTFARPHTAWVSNVSGERMTEAPDAAYWLRQAESAVEYVGGVRTMVQSGVDVFVELGGQATLCALGRLSCADAEGGGLLWLPSLRSGRDAWSVLLSSVASLYERGVAIDWRGAAAPFAHERAYGLPTYPFQRRVHWASVHVVQESGLRPDYHVAKPFSDGLVEFLPTISVEEPLLTAFNAEISSIAVDVDAVYRLLDEISVMSVLSALSELSFDAAIGRTFSAPSVRSALDLLDAAHVPRLLESCFGMLSSAGYLTSSSGSASSGYQVWTVTKALPSNADLKKRWTDVEVAVKLYPSHKVELGLTLKCGRVLRGVLSGTVNPLELLFPPAGSDDSLSFAALYRESPSVLLYNTLMTTAIAGVVHGIRSPIRLIEIGGGTGGTTCKVLPALSDVSYEYMFTDVSTGFLSERASEFGAYPMQFARLDIEKSPAVQGFMPGTYDLVVAANVLHATRDIVATMSNVRSLLVPGGRLVLLEVVEDQAWVDLTAGLLPGWWLADDNVRSLSPLMSERQWVSVLLQTGFEDIVAVGESQKIVIAQAAREYTFTFPDSPTVLPRSRIGLLDCTVDGTPDGTALHTLLAKTGAPVVRIHSALAASADRSFAGFILLCDDHVDNAVLGTALDVLLPTRSFVWAIQVSPHTAGPPHELLLGRYEAAANLSVLTVQQPILDWRLPVSALFSTVGSKRIFAALSTSGELLHLRSLEPAVQTEIAAASKDASLETRLASADGADEYASILLEHVTALTARVLHCDTALVPVSGNFIELGMDSLMLVELSNAVVGTLTQFTVPKTIVYEHGSVASLSKALCSIVAENAATQLTPISRVPSAVFSAHIDDEAAMQWPASHGQRRFWFLNEMLTNSSVYNVPLGLQLYGAFDVEAMRKTFSAIVKHHTALRTSLLSEDGVLYERLLPLSRFEAAIAALTVQEVAGDESAIHAAIQCVIDLPFDLRGGELCRFAIFSAGKEPEYAAVLLVVHHSIMDGTSGALLVRDIQVLYNALVDGTEPALVPSSCAFYGDFAEYEARWMQGAASRAQRSYWRGQLRGASTELLLPLDKVPPAVASGACGHVRIAFASELVKQLRSWCRTEHVTLFGGLLACYTVLLHFYTGQTDFLVGTLVDTRAKPEFASAVGFYINTLLLRMRFDASQSVDVLLKQVWSTVVGSLANGFLPYDEVVREMQNGSNGVRGDASSSSLFQTMFSLVADYPTVQLRNVDHVKPLPHSQASELPLLFEVLEQPDGALDLGVKFATDLYEEATALDMCAHFFEVVRSIVSAPTTQLVSQVRVLSLAEETRLSSAWNDTEMVDQRLDEPLYALVARQIVLRPGQPAIVFGKTTLTYAQLGDRVGSLARILARIQASVASSSGGARSQPIVAICSAPSIENVIAVLAAAATGFVYVPLNPDYPMSRTRFILGDSAPDVLVLTDSALRYFFDSEFDGAVVHYDRRTASWQHSASSEGATAGQRHPLAHGTPESLAYIMYTSGSTGRPKGVCVQQRSVVNFVLWAARLYGIDGGTRCLSRSSFSFDVFVEEVFVPLCAGGTVVVAPLEAQKDIQLLVSLVALHKVTWIDMFPTLLQQVLLVPDMERQLASLTLITCGGEALGKDVVGALQRRLGGIRIDNSYGLTETTITACTYAGVDELARTVPIGHPIANTQVHVLNEYMQHVPVGVPGELFVSGLALAQGYHNRPDLTQRAFIDNPFVGDDERARSCHGRLFGTGDRVRLLRGGALEFLGRRDTQVKLRGFRIELGAVAAVLKQADAVLDALAAVRSGKLVAYVLPVDAAMAEESAAALRTAKKAWRAAMEEQLPAYMVPNAIVVVPEWPLLDNGKLNYARLPEPSLFEDLGVAGDGDGAQHARNVVELRLARIVVELLGVADGGAGVEEAARTVGIHDSFFALGCTSLTFIQLALRLHSVFGVTVPVARIYNAPTIAQLAKLLGGGTALAVDSGDVLLPIRPSGTQRPVYLVHSGAGTAFPYMALAPHLPDTPLFGINNSRFGRAAGDGAEWRDVQQMAAAYADLVQAVQPRGPYRLGGWSFGGFIAFEMACVLEARGEAVDVVFMLDSLNLAALPASAREAIRAQGDAMVLDGVLQSHREVIPGEMRALHACYRASLDLVLDYTPTRTYGGRVVVCKAAEKDMRFAEPLADAERAAVHALSDTEWYGWRDIVPARQRELRMLAGSHFELFGVHAPQTAATIAELLRGRQRQGVSAWEQWQQWAGGDAGGGGAGEYYTI